MLDQIWETADLLAQRLNLRVFGLPRRQDEFCAVEFGQATDQSQELFVDLLARSGSLERLGLCENLDQTFLVDFQEVELDTSFMR